MALSIDIRRQVESKIGQWAKESAMHFCSIAQREGARFENITYPTGLKMVRVSHYLLAEAAEVELRTAKMLRANGYKVVA